MSRAPREPGVDRLPRVVCDGCGETYECTMISDDSDPNKGRLVDEGWFAYCPHCKYDFILRIQMKEFEDQNDEDNHV